MKRLIVAVVVLFGLACSGSGGAAKAGKEGKAESKAEAKAEEAKAETKEAKVAAKEEKLGERCAEAGTILNNPSSDPETLGKQIADVLINCSAACDAGVEGTCKELDEHTDALCAAAPSVCVDLCANAVSPSLKRKTCHPK